MITIMLVIMGFWCKMAVIRQMRWGELQSVHSPVFAQGVSMFKLLALMGAATSLILFNPLSRSRVTLLIP
jgi:hypothetical protein